MAILTHKQSLVLDGITSLQLVVVTLFSVGGVLLNLAYMLHLLPATSHTAVDNMWLTGLGGGALVLMLLCGLQHYLDKPARTVAN